MKAVLLILWLAVLPAMATDYELFVLAGQSNAQGWKGDARRYPRDRHGFDKTIPFYHVSPGIGSSGGKWTTLGPQPGRFKKGYFGPEVGFAREISAQGVKVAVFKYTLGATSLDRQWKRPGGGGLYDAMTAELSRAVKQLRSQGHHVRIAGLIWIQGESDAIDADRAGRYRENLEALLKHFRSRVADQPDLPVILGLDDLNPFVQQHSEVVKAQQSISEADPAIRFVTMKGLAKADRTHLKPAALYQHGERLAEAMLPLLKRR